MITETAIQKAMKNLGISRDEALEMLKEDEAINHGENPHPLTPEQEKASKAARICNGGPRKSPVHRERKPNNDKRAIIEYLTEKIEDFVTDCGDAEEPQITITNPERQVDFTIRGTRYRIVLSAPRK